MIRLTSMNYLMLLTCVCLMTSVQTDVYGTDMNSQECTKYFKYTRKLGVWSGVLTIPVRTIRPPLPVRVQLEMSLKAILPSKYSGVIELADIAEDLFEKMMNNEISTIKYNVLFPKPTPIPAVLSLTVNDKILCRGKQLTGNIVTVIKLEHEFPTNYQLISAEYIKSKYQATGWNRGDDSTPEELESVGPDERWPWLVAILIKVDDRSLQFHCSGTLVSRFFVLTAGHCFSEELYLEPKNYILYLGKHDLSKWNENDSQIAEINRVHIHPDFDGRNFTADIALVQLNHPVTLNKLVRPMCLWQGEPSLHKFVGKEGILVGWGKDESTLLIKPLPRMVKLPVIRQEECLRSQIDFFYITSDRTFCAGTRNGKGPCNGDSGSALIFYNRDTTPNHWYVRGIVSVSLYDTETDTCDFNHFTVFTDVAKFLPWLSEIMRSFDRYRV